MGDPLFMATEWLKIVTIVAFSLPAFFLFIKYRRDSKIVGKLICFLTLLYIIATSIMGLATAALGFFMIYDSGIDSYYSFGVLGVLPIAFLTLIIAQKFNKRFSAFLHRRLVSNKTIIAILCICSLGALVCLPLARQWDANWWESETGTSRDY